MFKESFKEVFDKFKFQFFCRIFDLVRERDGSLTAMEAFSLEIIDMLQAPTVSQFADFLDISQSNATYKVNSLIRKGYLVRKVSDLDRREAHLILSEKYRSYMSLLTSYEDKVMDRIAVTYESEDKLAEIFEANGEEIRHEVLADTISRTEPTGFTKSWNINGEKVVLGVEKQ